MIESSGKCSRAFRAFPATALLCLSLGLAACQSGGPKSASATSQAHDSEWGMARIKDAIALLNEGQPDKARIEIVKALQARPGDMLAQSLLKQIDTDPKQLLGQENFTYASKEDDSMSSLAQRFLGDPTKAYALARYNGLASPMQFKPGSNVLIPGKRKPAPTVAKKPPSAAPAKKPTVVAKPAPAPKPASPAGNPGQAARLRGQGLAALNGGAINRAVTLLRQALAYDPGNAIIRNDLARALRIQGSVSGRP